MRWNRPRGEVAPTPPVDYAKCDSFVFVRAVNWQGNSFLTPHGDRICNGEGAWLPKPYAELLIKQGIAKYAVD